jgi:signal transduction histidine kinase
MRLGTRITLSTAALVIVALGVYGFAAVRIRRAELQGDLERETQSLGNALRVAFEAAAAATGRVRVASDLERQSESVGSALPAALREALAAEDPRRLVERIEEGAPGGEALRVRWVDLAAAPAPLAERARRVQITGEPWGEHVEEEGRPVYSYMVPVRDERGVAFAIDLERDESDAARELGATARNVGLTVLAVSLVLALLVWATTRGGISDPLKRLVEGIDEVTRGDLTRAILRERDDEIGDLAERFNQMTASLRDARAEMRRGVEAKLALEARLRHSEKLATIGQLAAGIAHEVGTPLNVIGGRARTIERKSADAGEVAKNASIIAAQAARITKIIQQLLDYARKKVAERAPVDLTSVIKDSIDFLEHQLASSGVTARVAPYAREPDGEGPERPIVPGDADQLQQVCLNLCLNAIQAMERGGTMAIATRGLTRRKPGLDVAPPGRYVVLEVADSGVGIPPEDRERIFEPFYSTKQDGGGTGLGLAVSQGIVKDHDGWIEIEAREGGGTIFRVFLPAPEAEPEATAASGGEPNTESELKPHGPI